MSFEKQSFKIVKNISTKKRKNVTFVSEKSHPNCLDEVIDNDLCCGCGTCVGACPYNILDINLSNNQNPYLVADCPECDICNKACPALDVDILGIREKAKAQNINIDNKYGAYIKFALGHSTNKEIQAKSASGGIATSLLEYMLETKQVDCVIIVGMDDEFPAVRIIREKEDIKQGMQSKYGYVPLGVVWTELIKTKETFAFVGLPCHISGFNNAAKIYKGLAKQCRLKIGLFCGYTQKYGNIELFKYMADSLEGKFRGWREGSYPGGVHIYENNEIEKLIPYNKFMSFSIPFYTMQRCILCEDGTAEEADIVLGDAHKYGDDYNLILVRTHKGEEILEDSKKEGYVNFSEITKEKADAGTIGWVPIAKGCYPQVYNNFLRIIGKKTPNFHIKRDCSFKTLVIGFFKTMIMLWSNKYYIKWFGFGKFTGVMGWMIYNFPGSIKPSKANLEKIKSIYKEPYIDYKSK